MDPNPWRRLAALVAPVLVLGLSEGAPLVRGAEGAALDSPEAEAKIGELIARMSLQEKLGQLNQLSAGALTGPSRYVALNQEELIRKGQVGSLLNVVHADAALEFQKAAVEGSRLHIPLLFGYDVIHGFKTTFPIPLALSATWDTDLIERTARRAAVEASAQGIRWTFSPMVDIAHDARWGRIAEGAGEDPYLGSAIARAYVRGYQGDRLSDPTSVAACAKHFVGYGAVEGGREYNSTEISDRTLRNVYLPPFHAAVDSGAATLMSAFNAINDVPASANAFTLTQVLRNEWGFQGFVVSDWTAVHELVLHGVARDDAVAARKSLGAGVDMDMQSEAFLRALPDLVASGAVPVAQVDEAVRRVLRVKMALGLFEHPYPRTPDGGSEGALDLALARTAAEESFVLLKNEPVGVKALLPVALKRGGRLALIGPLSDSAVDMLGSWSGQGSALEVVTLRQALSERAAKEGFSLSVTPTADTVEPDFSAAVAAARSSDLVLLALGEKGRASGEASARARLDLPGNQERLLEAVVASGKPVVLVVFSGRPLALEWAAHHVSSIVMAWFPGLQAGPALADALFGDSDFSGRLTASLPHTVGQEPLYYDTLNTGRPRADPIGLGATKADPFYVTGYADEPNTALYPFGYGLSYTTFGYSEVRLSAPTVSAAALERGEGALTASAEIRNTGTRPGTETVQLYIRLRGTSVARPVHELKGFARVSLKAGESRTVSFTLGPRELAFWNLEMKDVVEPSSLYVWIAPDSAAGAPAEAEITP